jgi:hypothetical protein
MNKIIPPDSWDFGEEPIKMIKLASAGLKGNDLSSFIKRSSHQLALAVKKMSFHPGEVPIHLIAMGCDEFFSANRNADAWTKQALSSDHPTFVKLARFYRDHANKDKSRSYGVVKESYFNEPMGRVELIVALNGSKEAAHRNGGLVADQELDILESGRPLAVSMSTDVPYDVCSSCGHKASKRADYCLGTDEGGSCEHGGMRRKLGRSCEDGHVLRAMNPVNKFKDISKVHRGADRTAFVTGKVASDRIIGGAELAEMLGLNEPTWTCDFDGSNRIESEFKLLKLARDLAALESSWIIPGKWVGSLVQTPGLKSIPDNITVKDAAAALAKEGAVFPIVTWLSLTTNTPYEKCAEDAQTALFAALPRAFRLLAQDENTLDLLKQSISCSEPATKFARDWASEIAPKVAFTHEHARRRLWAATLKNTEIKAKSASSPTPAAQELTKRYAAYVVNALANRENFSDFPLTLELAIEQNQNC